MKECGFDGCEKPTRNGAADLCDGHYQQRRHGKTLTPLESRAPRHTAYGTYSGDPAGYLRAWRKRNPQSVLRDKSVRMALKERVNQEIDRQLVFDVFCGACYLCGEALTDDRWVLEHVVPAVKGGTHTYSNVAPACSTCNIRKKDKELVVFYMENGRV